MEWKEQVDTILEAKDWAEAINSARDEVARQASRDDAEEEVEEAREHLMELNESHAKILENLRSGNIYSA